jgi:hypothetical protein
MVAVVSDIAQPLQRNHNNPYGLEVDTLEPRLVPNGSFMFCTLAFKREIEGLKGPVWSQCSYRAGETPFNPEKPVDTREQALAKQDFDKDLYQAQFFFKGFRRKKSNFLAATLLFSDFETYKIPMFNGKTVEEQKTLLLMEIANAGLPLPSLLVFSGRGFHGKWLMNRYLPARTIKLIEAMLKHLQIHLAHLGADDKAVDICRVLRVPGSINTKSGERVRILWTNIDPITGDVVRYDPDMLRDEILPEDKATNHARREAARVAKKEIQAKRRAEKRAAKKSAKLYVLGHERDRRAEAQAPKPRGMHIRGWARGVLEDINTIIDRRWGNRIPSGHQDTFLHIAACQLAKLYPADQLLEQVRVWARGKFDGWTEQEIDSVQASLLERAVRAAKGETVEYEGRQVSPVYSYSKDSMIYSLAIQSDEMQHMQCLINDEEKNRRRRVKREEERRAAGKPTREEYVAGANDNRVRIVALREQGVSWRKIAAEIGISMSQVRRLHDTPITVVERRDSADLGGVPGCALHLGCDGYLIEAAGAEHGAEDPASVCQSHAAPQRTRGGMERSDRTNDQSLKGTQFRAKTGPADQSLPCLDIEPTSTPRSRMEAYLSSVKTPRGFGYQTSSLGSTRIPRPEKPAFLKNPRGFERKASNTICRPVTGEAA